VNINTIKETAVALLIFSLIGSAGIAEEAKSHYREQLHFSAEGTSVRRPVPIPEDVLAILRKDDDVHDGLEHEGIAAEQIPSSWFSASAIHLNNANQVDLVVMGQGPLRGANVITFWVFRSTSHGHELVLNAPAHDLIVANTRWKGYREIELVSMTARQISTVLLRFDGKGYKEFKASSEHIQ